MQNNSPLTFRDIGGYLIGRRESIEKVASDRNSLWYGLTFVIVAGFCREYDQELIVSWGTYLFPLVASTIMAAWIFLWMQVYFPKGLRQNSFPTFLSLFWMTAPCAWVYALPVERYFDSLTAIKINMSLLLFVAIWRVVLFARVLTLLTGKRMYVMILAASAVVVVPLGFFGHLNKAIGIMGGGQHSPEQRLILDFSANVLSVAFWGGIVFLLSFVFVCTKKNTEGWSLLPLAVMRQFSIKPVLLSLLMMVPILWAMPHVQAELKNLMQARSLFLYAEDPATFLDEVDGLLERGIPQGRDLQPNVYGGFQTPLNKPLLTYLELKPHHSDYLHQQVELYLTRSIEAVPARGFTLENRGLFLRLPLNDPIRRQMHEKYGEAMAELVKQEKGDRK